MIEYMIHEMPDLNKTGEPISYPKMVVKRNLSTEEFIDRIALPGSGISRSTLKAALMRVAEQLALSLADGYSVTLDEIGIFTAALGYKEGREREDMTHDDAPNRNARSIEVAKVNFKVDQRLVNTVRAECRDIRRRGERHLQAVAAEADTRLAMAQRYIEEHGQMTVKEYAEITGLRYHTAQRELKSFGADPIAGIAPKGRRPHIVYVKCNL